MGCKRVLFVVVASLSLFSSNLFAQRGYTARTAEYLTATSDLVVMAVVADLKVEKNSSTDDESGLEKVTAILDVHRCLKGHTDDSVKLQIELPIGSDNLAKWHESRVELFWFLNLDSPDDLGVIKIVPHRELRFFASVVEPPEPNSEQPPIMLLNVDFEPLTSIEMIERTIADFQKRFGVEKIGGMQITVSKEIAARTGMSKDWNGCLVPTNYMQMKSK